MIEGLQIEKEFQNGKVYYQPAVLTVKGVGKWNDEDISFEEISGFWSLKYEPQAYVYSRMEREKGTNPSDLKLHVGDVASFKLGLNPNKKTGGFYHNVDAVGSPSGEVPIQKQQQGGSWASEPAATGEPYVDKWDLKDIHIRKAQALNLLTEVLTSGDKVNAPKIVLAMGFTDVAEAIDAVASGWNSLRRGLPIEFPVAVSDMEEEVPDLADDDLDEDVETLSWD